MREWVGAGGVVAALSVAGDLTRGHRVPDDVDWSAEADSRAAPWYGPRAGQTGVADFFRDLAGSIEITEFTPAPFLTPSLFRVRGFVAGLVMGFVFFAAVAGLLYATSLYLQFGRGLAPLPTAGLMAPLSAGIIAASFSARGLVERLGRRLVALGFSVMGAGTAGCLAVILLAPDATWALLLPLLACGLGMGGCFGSVFAVALGDVRPDQAGSASGTLNAVQQIATAAGAALISAAYLAAASTGTARDAVAASLVIVLVITALSFAALPLLPRRAATTTS